MCRRNVLFLAESLLVGGAEKALISILKSLDYSKFDVTLMLISRSGDFVKDVERIEGLRVRAIVNPTANPISSIINVIKVKAIYKWLPAPVVGNYLCKGYDIVISFCEGYLTKWVGASTVSCRKIAWVHTDMVDNDWPVKTRVFNTSEEEKIAYHKFDDVIAVSEAVAIGLKSKFRLENVTTIYNIVDANIVNKSYQYAAYKPIRNLNLIPVGRLEEVKGYSNLILL